MTSSTRRALICIGAAIVLLVGLVAYQSERQRCVTGITAPFHAHIARGVALLADGRGDEIDTTKLTADADRLEAIAAGSCTWPW